MKHLKIGFYLLFLLPLLASSCDKNELLEHTIVKGIVNNENMDYRNFGSPYFYF